MAIEKHHEFLLSFIATMFFGCQFDSVSKERLYVAKLSVSPQKLNNNGN